METENHESYLDEQGIIKAEYLTTLPKSLAARMEGERPQTSMNQLRSFYTHAKRAEHAWKRGALPLAAAVNEIKKLEYHANDRLKKGRISAAFNDFIRKNTASVTAAQDGKVLEAFLDYFEALVGFCAGRLNERERP